MRLLSALPFLALLTTAAAAPGPKYVPVHEADFPDPFILEHRGEYLGYATNTAGINLPMASSRDLISWENVQDPANPKKRLDAMPVLAPWVREGRTWAPEVMEIGGRWLLYYTANHKKKDVQCIGLAIAADPRGPFRDTSTEPFVCQYELGGTIDAHPFRDVDESLYFYYKSDGNNPKFLKPSVVWGQRLSADGTRLVGQPVALLHNDKHWEWRVVEAPAMVRRAGGYTMFFSGNHFGWEADQRLSNYATGYATCRTALGPCTDAPENPWLRSSNIKGTGCLSGPGHPTIISMAKRQFIAFHAWAATAGCRKADQERFLYVAPLSWTASGEPEVGPSLRPSQTN
jgi:beta-xylosidase